MKHIDYLWKDRLRHLGLPLSFTRYALSEDRLFLETGLLNTKCEEIILYRIRDISLTISLWQRIFGVGTIKVESSDKTRPVLEIKNIKHPRDVKELLHQTVEEMKRSRRMRTTEIMTDDCEHDADDALDDIEI